jgi:hypothetical protein
MAKRRNPKKEKAERNKAYARQFRKKYSRKFTRNKRFGHSNFKQHEEESVQSNSKQENKQTKPNS